MSGRSPAAGAAALGAGALVALALPPWGWWPSAFVGLALLDRLVAGRPARARMARTWLFGVGWLLPGMGWMVSMTAPGWLFATSLYSGYLAVAAAVAPPGRWRWAALPAAVTLAECLRWSFPFGGVPLASLAIGQAAGPLAPVVRVGGALALTALVVVVGMALSALAARAWRPALALAGTGALVLAVAAVAPRGADVGTLRVAAVQGGGEQGTRKGDVSAREVFERHLAASGQVAGPVDLVVWPENVIDTDGPFEAHPWAAVVADEARRLGAVLAVGVTDEDPARPDRFLNAQVAFDPDGTLVDRYDKVRRVPFGEYMPLRSFLEALGAPTELVPRDALAGTGAAVLDTAVGRLGVVISWEVFFGGRARDAIGSGGTVLLNPTNGSSYEGTVLQTQQVASSRLRALETGRWVVQAAPTGFSALINPDGRVVQRSAVGERTVVSGEVATRRGLTWYGRGGDRPVVAVALAVLVAARVASRRRPGPRSGQLEQDGDGPVVDQLDVHVGPEAARGHGGAQAP